VLLRFAFYVLRVVFACCVVCVAFLVVRGVFCVLCLRFAFAFAFVFAFACCALRFALCMLRCVFAVLHAVCCVLRYALCRVCVCVCVCVDVAFCVVRMCRMSYFVSPLIGVSPESLLLLYNYLIIIVLIVLLCIF